MNQFQSYLILAFTLLSFSLFAQEGTLRGTITDKETGETLPFATVVIQGTTTGTQTDLDGKFFLKLPVGKHNIECVYTGYADQLFSEVAILDGEVTTMDIAMGTGAIKIDEIVVEAKKITNTEAAINTIRRKSSNILDGISSQLISRSGDGDAGEIAKRVTGVSIEGGKHVYVRGLGDRYTKTILNGMAIPGLDPDRNSVQMDIFPSNLINNLLVYKTFTPDLAGDFTGGIVNVVTKDFPETKTMDFAASFGYNPNVHFNKDFILYDREGLDAIGLGAAPRSLKFHSLTKIPDPALDDPATTELTNKFSNKLAATSANNFLDQSYSFSLGNQMNNSETNRTLGYSLAINYKNNYQFMDDYQVGTYFKDGDASKYELELEQTGTGNLAVNDVLWNVHAVGAVKKEKSKYSLSLLHIQNGKTEASQQTQQNYNETGATLIKDNLTYTQRSISNALLSAKYSLNSNLEMDVKLSPTYSKISDPDVRTTAFSLREGQYTLNPGDGAGVRRIFRDLDEINADFQWNTTYRFKAWKDRGAKLKFGIANNAKGREFQILNYFYRQQTDGSVPYFSGDPDELLSESTIWNVETDEGFFLKGNFEPANSYRATSNVGAVYLMNELQLTNKLQAIYGLRVEKANNWYTGSSNNGLRVYEKESVLDELDFLPSVNLVYKVNDMMNLRGSFTRTVARPSFKEKSIAQIYDPVTNRSFVGNIDLEASDITNVDLRFEKFFMGADLISFSAFYKQFQNPIELVAYELDPNSVQPKNVGNGQLLGGELELKKSLSFLSSKLEDFALSTNLTYVYSQIEMDAEEELPARIATAREGEVVKTTRQMQGQSPYIINAGLNYNNRELGLNANLSYNVQGKRLAIVGGSAPDVYESPFNSLNFKLGKSFGPENRMRLSVSANNLLGAKRIKNYENYQATPVLFEYLNPGRAFAVGFNYSFF